LDDERFLGPGWSATERSSDFSFRWATGAESIVVAPLKDVDDYRIELRCGPFSYPGAPAQLIAVFANGRPAGLVTLDKGFAEYAVDVPASRMKANLNQFVFRYDRVRSPADVGLSNDPRPLAMQCDRLRFTRLLTYHGG
jgi:hypothetical protein